MVVTMKYNEVRYSYVLEVLFGSDRSPESQVTLSCSGSSEILATNTHKQLTMWKTIKVMKMKKNRRSNPAPIER